MSEPYYDLDTVKAAARGQWTRIISSLCGFRASILTRPEKPCPLCGGTERFCVYEDFAETGGLRCNTCHNSRNKDGFNALMWRHKCTFPEAIKMVAEFLGVEPSKPSSKRRSGGGSGGGSNGSAGSYSRDDIDPAKDLEFVEWNDMLASLWCLKKPPIKLKGLKACDARMAKYKSCGKTFDVIALPIKGEAGEPVGWCLYNRTGGTLPFKGGETKVKIAYGSKSGTIGTVGMNP